MWTEILSAAAISAVFLVPALVRPTVGRGILGALFIGGSVFNLLYTLPNTPQSLLDLVSTAPIPPYREVMAYVVAWNFATAFVIAVVTFELSTGSLIPRSARASPIAQTFALGTDWKPGQAAGTATGRQRPPNDRRALPKPTADCANTVMAPVEYQSSTGGTLGYFAVERMRRESGMWRMSARMGSATDSVAGALARACSAVAGHPRCALSGKRLCPAKPARRSG